MQTFLHNKRFFLIAPRDLHYYWASAQPCADRLRRSTTPFLPLGMPQNGVSFPKDRTYRAFFVLLHIKEIFSDGPRGICIIIRPVHSLGSFVHAAESAILREKPHFWPSQRLKKVLLTEQGCARLRTSLIIMQIPRGYNKRFFLIAPRDLHYIRPVRSLAQPCSVNNTFFSLWNAPKWGFFPKDRTYRAFFVLLHKRNFFRMVPEGLNAFGSFVHAAESAS